MGHDSVESPRSIPAAGGGKHSGEGVVKPKATHGDAMDSSRSIHQSASPTSHPGPSISPGVMDGSSSSASSSADDLGINSLFRDNESNGSASIDSNDLMPPSEDGEQSSGSSASSLANAMNRAALAEQSQLMQEQEQLPPTRPSSPVQGRPPSQGQESDVLQMLRTCRSLLDVRKVFEETAGLSVFLTQEGDVRSFVDSLGQAGYSFDKHVVTYSCPLTQREGRMSTNRNSITSTDKRKVAEYAKLKKCEEELHALANQRIQLMMGVINLEVQSDVYHNMLVDTSEENDKATEHKVDREKARRKAMKEYHKMMKAAEKEISKKTMSKRRRHDHSSDEEDETESDVASDHEEYKPRKKKRKDNVRPPIKKDLTKEGIACASTRVCHTR